jgi:hypothetical protein
LARKRSLGKPVKASFAPAKFGTFRARTSQATIRPKNRQRSAVKKSVARSKRFGLKPVVHSLALAQR